MKNFLRVLKYAAGYKKYVWLTVLFNVLYAIFNLLSFAFFIPVLEVLFEKSSSADLQKFLAPNPHTGINIKSVQYGMQQWTSEVILQAENVAAGKSKVLVIIAGIIVITFLLKNTCRYFAMFFLSPIRNGVISDLRNQMFHKSMHLPLSFFSDEKKGDIMSRMTYDVQEVEWSILSSLEAIFREPLSIVLVIGSMFFIDAKLTLFMMLFTPISILAIVVLGKGLKRTSTKAQDKMGDLLSNMEEMLSGLKVIKAFGAEKYTSGKFEENNNRFRILSIRLFRKRDLASPLSEVLGMITIASVLVVGGVFFVFEGGLSGSIFIGYILLLYLAIAPIKTIAGAYSNVQKGAAAIDRINKIMHAENSIVDPQNPQTLNGFEKEIEFKNVCFSYEKDEVLSDINLKIQKGKSIALVGHSGGGKSTLADLIPRFYDVTKGEILIDGINIRSCKISDVRSLIGVVTQDSVLFNDTVFNNISFGGSYSKEQLIEAAKVANAHDFIVQLPNGYDTVIGDKGDKLSGGQRQRLCIARAVLKNPPILILDEATSALDTASEKLVQDALQKVMSNRTSVVIAHRLSTIQHADEIIVLDKGKIAERGKHSELIAQEGIYFQLCQMQSFQ
ncbi:MAG: ABC transporter ATP-binding protein [Bacteroidetes bacterium]|nr:ABC transporter ATP-binding protein [Bacteroidota bacterium]